MSNPNIVTSRTPYRLCIKEAKRKAARALTQKGAPTYPLRIEERGSKIIFSK